MTNRRLNRHNGARMSKMTNSPRRRHRAPVAILFGLLFVPRPTPAETLGEVAERYLAAIEAQDWQQMEALLDPDARYQDFSMEHFGGPAIDLRGPEAIVGFWRNSSADAGTLSIDFDFPDRFAAGPNLILRGYSEVEARGEAWQLPLEVITARFPQITHLRISEGRITYHADHVDYGAAEQQIAAQVEVRNQRHGTAVEFPLTPVDTGLLETAEAYLKALHANDWRRLASWLGPDSMYLNYTAEYRTGSVERAQGGEAMLKLFRDARASSGTLHLAFDRKQAWVAGPNVFLYGTYMIEMSGQAWGLGEGTASFEVPMVVHLRFVDDTLTHHVEYIDYVTGFGPLGAP